MLVWGGMYGLKVPSLLTIFFWFGPTLNMLWLMNLAMYFF